MTTPTAPRLVLGLLLTLLAPGLLANSPAPIRLWPDGAPGESKPLPPEGDTTKPGDREVAGRPVVRIGNVSDPTITVYPADPAHHTGAAVLVCPGGGYHIVALDIEGTEVCAWLNSLGISAVLLKYRVPAREGQPRFAAPLQDAQRALGLVRHRAAEWGIDPERIGVLGFSAGGHLSATLGNQWGERSYPRQDAADDVSCRPDFVVLIYPGGLVSRERGDVLGPELAASRERTPPTFIAMTQDDPVRVENALVYYAALHRAGVPAELHVYPTGGHGYGLRPTGEVVASWPDRVEDWLRAGRWLPGRK